MEQRQVYARPEQTTRDNQENAKRQLLVCAQKWCGTVAGD
jgi:hypothetical protein